MTSAGAEKKAPTDSPNRSTRSRLPRCVRMVGAFLVVAGSLGLATVTATAQSTSSTCPSAGAAAYADLTDQNNYAFNDSRCLKELGIPAPGNNYRPDDNMTRSEMARFMARTYAIVTGTDAPIVSTSFTDVSADDPNADEIARIFGLRITTGTSPTTYSPGNPVIRGHMALFLARLYKKATGTDAPTADTPFTDISHTSPEQQTAIGQIYRLGVTTGTTPTTYSPGDYVKRREMASFVARIYRALQAVASGTSAETPTVPATVECVPGTDRDALVAFYNSLGGSSWRRSTNWLGEGPLGMWYGVSTDVGGCVTRIELGRNDLSGTIPSELGNLAKLETLNLAGNRSLNGEIPPELGHLAHLRSLRLNHNDLHGAIPAELGRLLNLETLFLSYNDLDGAIPDELGNLGRLRNLNLGGNALSGAIPAVLGNLSRLEKLDLRDNHLSGDVPFELANLSALHSYYFHGNPLTGCIPDSFRSLESSYATYAFDDPRPDLPPFCEATVSCATGTAVPNASTNPGLVSDCESLVAARDAIAGTGTLNWSPTTPIARWTGIGLGGSPQRVKSLELTGFDGEIPAELGDLDELETLVFKRPPFAGARYRSAGAPSLAPLEAGMRGEIPSELGRLSELRELKLGFNELSGEIPPQLGDLAKLRQLDLHRNNLTGDVPSQLGNLNDLTVLDLSANELGGPIPPELGNLAKLTVLHLAANDLTGAIPPQLSNLTRLTQLKLGFNDLTGAIPPQLGDLTRLRNLDLGPNRLTGQIPSELGALTGLSTLDLSSNRLTGEIPTALGNLTGLRILLLSVNQLTGCIPVEWEDVGFTFTDLASTSLPYCP